MSNFKQVGWIRVGVKMVFIKELKRRKKDQFYVPESKKDKGFDEDFWDK